LLSSLVLWILGGLLIVWLWLVPVDWSSVRVGQKLSPGEWKWRFAFVWRGLLWMMWVPVEVLLDYALALQSLMRPEHWMAAMGSEIQLLEQYSVAVYWIKWWSFDSRLTGLRMGRLELD
jgi:hypothetical protein